MAHGIQAWDDITMQNILKISTILLNVKNISFKTRTALNISRLLLSLDGGLSMMFMKSRLTQHVTLPMRGDRLLDVVVSDDAIPVLNVLVHE